VWSRAKDSSAFEGKVASVSASPGEVNGWIPPAWMALKSIIAMRRKNAPDTAPVMDGHEDRTVIETSVTEQSVTGPSSDDVSPEQVVAPSRKPLF
jgi:hypothetical protein